MIVIHLPICASIMSVRRKHHFSIFLLKRNYLRHFTNIKTTVKICLIVDGEFAENKAGRNCRPTSYWKTKIARLYSILSITIQWTIQLHMCFTSQFIRICCGSHCPNFGLSRICSLYLHWRTVSLQQMLYTMMSRVSLSLCFRTIKFTHTTD